MTRHAASLLLALVLALAPARAAVEIDVKGGGVRKINVAVGEFAGEKDLLKRGRLRELISYVVVNDLTRSGYFRASINPKIDHAPSSGAFPFHRELRSQKFEFALVGKVEAEPGGETRVTYELFDTITERSLGSFAYEAKADQARRIAHEISNWIHEQVLNEPGPFTSKIAYVLRRSQTAFELRVADYDGFNAQTVVSSPEAMMSPEWSADGNHILYVSFENDKPVVYRLSLLEGRRQVVANFRGNNSAPAIAPDNRVIAALSKDGPTQLYWIPSEGREPRRLRTSLGIDTEPDFAPDGRRLAFMSDAGGSPQIYLMDLTSTDTPARRVSRGSNYSVSPAFSPDGKHLAYVLRTSRGVYNIAVANVDSGEAQTITKARLADSPSFAPNGRILLFKDETNPAILNTISLNDRIRVPFERSEDGEVIDPVWGPSESDWY